LRIMIVTDAWFPQVNGVVRTLKATADELGRIGHDVIMVTPEGRWTFPLPSYPEIRLSLISAARIAQEIEEHSPEAIHIATEGPLGWAARRHCVSTKTPFTTGFHTQFAEYVGLRVPLPGARAIAWSILRHFHRPSRCVMAPTPSIVRELAAHGFTNAKTWTRGVDHDLFRPGPSDAFDLPRPITLFAGRLALEKNIRAFLELNTPGSKVIVGDGPDRTALQRDFPAAHFTGYRFGDELVNAIGSADVFVFPSLTDTFGLVMLEAMACGTPVAAFPVPSPIDVVREGVTGALDTDLAKAVERALKLDRTKVREASLDYTWGRTASLFESMLAPIPKSIRRPAAAQSPGFFHLR
jgi:glycosyltransferase involved in cell wall biosynthesis